MAPGKKGRRVSGTIRRLPSGRYQARRRGPEGRMYAAPVTFATKAEADRWLAAELTEQAHGLWIDPKAGRVALGDYSAEWMRSKAMLAPKTIELYEYLLARLILPALGDVELVNVTPAPGPRMAS